MRTQRSGILGKVAFGVGLAAVLAVGGLVVVMPTETLAQEQDQEAGKNETDATSNANKKEETPEKKQLLSTRINALKDKVEQVSNGELKGLVKKLQAAVNAASCAGKPATDTNCFSEYVGQAIRTVTGIRDKPENIEAARAQIEALVKTFNSLKARPKVEKPDFINVLGAYYGDVDAIGAAILRYGRADGAKGIPEPKHLKNLRGKTFAAINPDLYQVTPALEAASQDADRFCSATQAVRTLCHGRDQCFDSVGESATSITGDKLCGYDPAPYADARYKGLIIVYECLNEAVFEEQLNENSGSANAGTSPSTDANTSTGAGTGTGMGASGGGGTKTSADVSGAGGKPSTNKSDDKPKPVCNPQPGPGGEKLEKCPISRSWLPTRANGAQQRWALIRASEIVRLTCHAPPTPTPRK